MNTAVIFPIFNLNHFFIPLQIYFYFTYFQIFSLFYNGKREHCVTTVTNNTLREVWVSTFTSKSHPSLKIQGCDQLCKVKYWSMEPSSVTRVWRGKDLNRFTMICLIRLAIGMATFCVRPIKYGWRPSNWYTLVHPTCEKRIFESNVG